MVCLACKRLLAKQPTTPSIDFGGVFGYNNKCLFKNMICPNCKLKLKKIIFRNTEIDYCPKCLGIWFEEDELRRAKDDKDQELNWLDIDLWQDQAQLAVAITEKQCPFCSQPLYAVDYGQSGVRVEVCNNCKGVWLERGEFKKIIDYLQEKKEKEVLDNYTANLLAEAKEVFTGPEPFRSELRDFLAVSKLLKYKLLAQYPQILDIIISLPK